MSDNHPEAQLPSFLVVAADIVDRAIDVHLTKAANLSKLSVTYPQLEVVPGFWQSEAVDWSDFRDFPRPDLSVDDRGDSGGGLLVVQLIIS